MLLERVEIVGFRGINRLSLMLEQNNVLIGENAWGKSSLLDALTLLLSPEFDLYHFVRDDFWFPAGDIQGREHHLHIILTFRETEPGRHRVRRFRPLQRCWVPCDDGYHRVFYRLEGELADDDSVMTLRSFIDGEGEALALEDIDELARHLVRLMPVLRLRDARFMRRIHNGTVPHSPQIEITARQLDFLSRELVSHPQNLSDGQIRQGLSAMVQLLEHYFAEQSSAQTRHRLMRRRSHDEQRSWRYLDIINRMIDKPGGRSHRVILLGLFATLLQAKGTVRLDRDARPLLLIEDPETRLHPIMLSVAWHLLNLLPLQRMTTTNSGELLSLTPVEQVCRLVRESSRVSAWRLGPGGMNAEESRRIAFHIRFNRASSLFARCWLLVEGETETWVINELARQCGHHFDAEGVKVIEFAQSGLKPLIKFARRMGIQWHVLVDGDEAGKKYAATVRGLLNNDRELERDHLTALPALDMEHFMYRQGFDDVYHRVAQIPDNVPMNMRRVITKAIHRSSKPDLAIEVAMEAGRRGVDAVPTLLKKMFSRVLWLARGRAD
ncbi:TPA: ATP-dependent endonuclease [Klebsiella quasipneumoniae subsp. similipneumoniae]|jgi:putative ATP-dependent endonuclease of OLD family|uniref:ATP-dependent endonuclease n=1 Tax=Klebsiella quasipneumoniae TaxID=1463165 RepID=UPI000808CA78|nr:ATP-dependent endonuclease [Klebsiella quasipneumoniae]MCH9430631.1 ATP-dependent endonuclease [Klebsiella quasipneumoniae]MCL1508829.1 ATP-dependent endonuclease [Klebsiella quasipneumoniae]MCS4384993.1 ATP-dependent endonuclease [Klebsiella quasipneumoniae subsp. similipneumoniae]MCS4410878.1 ATP-dependent endonuclease [Klebsiella quasipneumoniae subsp. similipneumoniae]MCT8887389.1 ATP-dependent endonuclease [Klebsiella quasipneumoniae subsp. similipneumoniae]